MLLLETRLSISFQNVSVGGLNLCIWCCWCRWCCRRRGFFVVVTVDRVLTFVADGYGVSESDSSLPCRVRVYARVEDLCFVVVGALLVGINLFSLEGHAFHGVDSLVCFVVCLICFRCLSQRCVGGSYALRVSPAVTRLTVYRRPQVGSVIDEHVFVRNR